VLSLFTALLLLLWLSALGSTLLNLWLVPRLRPGTPATPASTTGPFVSIVIPARDEERAIGRTVRALLAQTYESLEVIVVNDRSTDRTGEILAAIDDPRLVVVHGEDDPPAGWLGKPWALAQGSRRATGELLLFIDADIHYAPEAVALAVAHQQRSGASMVALLPHFELRGFWENVAMPQLAIVAFSFMPLWLANRTTVPVIGIGGGPGNLVVRADYDAAGGHEALRGAIVDDVGLARLLRRAGHRTEAVLANDLVSLRMYHGLGEVVEGFTKNLFATMNHNYLVAFTGLGLMLAGHFLPYVLLFVPAVRMLAIATVATITLLRVILFASLRFRLDNALFLHPLLVVVWTWIFLRSIWITGVRNELRWRGRTYPR
jgi:chlorobactene glucosyltransferase